MVLNRISVNPAELSPELVYPGAEDVFYDGTDADCMGNDDCDQDEDLFRAEIGYCATIFDADEQGDCDDEDLRLFQMTLQRFTTMVGMTTVTPPAETVIPMGMGSGPGITLTEWRV